MNENENKQLGLTEMNEHCLWILGVFKNYLPLFYSIVKQLNSQKICKVTYTLLCTKLYKEYFK